jgi:predicted RNase H-like HicB family nuclease
MHNLTFTQELIREGDAIVAYCPELDVSSCGATPEQARNNLRTAVRLFTEEAAKMGTLADILSEAGYDLTRTTLASPVFEITQGSLSLEGLAI